MHKLWLLNADIWFEILVVINYSVCCCVRNEQVHKCPGWLASELKFLCANIARRHQKIYKRMTPPPEPTLHPLAFLLFFSTFPLYHSSSKAIFLNSLMVPKFLLHWSLQCTCISFTLLSLFVEVISKTRDDEFCSQLPCGPNGSAASFFRHLLDIIDY